MMRLAEAAICIGLLSCSAIAGQTQEREPPLELTLSYWGGEGPHFRGAREPIRPVFYQVSMTASGQVVREGQAYSLEEARGSGKPYFPIGPQHVSAASRAKLRRLIQREHFFEMQACYGCPVDLGARMIEVDLAGRRKRVGFLVLDGESVPLATAQGLLRLWYGAMAAITKRDPAEYIDPQDARILARKR